MLKKYFIAYSFVLVDFLFVATFVIKIKKKGTKVRQTFQISVTEVNCASQSLISSPRSLVYAKKGKKKQSKGM